MTPVQETILVARLRLLFHFPPSVASDAQVLELTKGSLNRALIELELALKELRRVLEAEARRDYATVRRWLRW